MFVENFKCDKEWKRVDSVKSGDSFLIQNTSNTYVEFIVLAQDPTDDDKGGVLMPKQQLAFGGEGELYVRCHATARLYIEEVK